MAAIRWKSGVSGNFSDASNWSTATVPGSSDDALINASGTYTVESSLTRTVHSLTMAPGATLEILNGEFDLDFFGADTNNGTIHVYSDLAVFGALNNTGVIDFFGAPTQTVSPHVVGYFQPTGTSTNSGTIEAINDAEVFFNIAPVSGPVSFTNYGIIEALGGSIITIGGNFGATSSFTNAGTIEALGQGSLVDLFSTGGTITNSGHLVADGGTIQISNPNSISGLGTAEIRNGGTLFIGTSFAENTTFDPGANGTLQLGFGAAFTGTLSGFTTGDRIDFSGLQYSGSALTFDSTTNLLTVSNGANAPTIHLTGSYVASGFSLSSDTLGYAQVTYAPSSTEHPPAIDTAHSRLSGTVSERPSTTGSLAIDTASGVIAFTDQDLSDRPTASVVHRSVTYQDAQGHLGQLTDDQVFNFENAFLAVPESGNTNSGKMDWGYTITDNALDFLGLGETITVKATIEIGDGHGGKIDQDVAVTLNGADDAPTAIPHFLTVPKSSTLSADAAHGALAGASDPDIHDTLTAFAVNGLPSNVGQRIAGAYGSLALNADGSLAYTPNKNISFSGSQVTDHFSYSVTDSHGDVVTSAFDIAVLKNGNSVPINPSQGLVITPHWDTSVFTLSPAQQAQYENAVDAAINILEKTFSNPVKLDINFGWGEEGGNTIIGNDAAASLSNKTPILTDYSTIYAKLVSDPLYDKTAFKSLPFPTSTDGKFYEGKTFYVTNAEAKALGLTPLAGSDGDVGLNGFSQLAGFDTFTFDPNQRSTPNKIDAIGVLIHEITEVMGRVSAIGQTGVGLEANWHGWYTPLDLFRYSTAGVHALTSGPGSFSEGKRLLLPFNNPELVKGDAGDWARGISGDSFGGWDFDKKLEFSPTDHLVMSALDWHLV